MNIYGVKAVLVRVVDNSQIFYEEMIMSVKASSFDEAYKKADTYVKGYCHDYVNSFGQTVKCSEYELLDCFLAFDEEDDVREIYACTTANKSRLEENEYYDIITSQCSAEELYPLRHE